MTRRGLIGAAAAALSAGPAGIAAAQDPPSPKSTHTRLTLKKSGVYSIDVDAYIQRPAELEKTWLYYPSLQVNFDKMDEWAHGGVQWSQGRKANWGGGWSGGNGKSVDGKETRIGTVRTQSPFISKAVVWLETGYGVVCTTFPARVIWRDPVYRCDSAAGVHPVGRRVATFDGNCSVPYNTNQAMRTTNDGSRQWTQSTFSKRTTPHDTVLWSL